MHARPTKGNGGNRLRSHPANRPGFANGFELCHNLPMTVQQAPTKGSYVNSLFYDEPAGTFSHGHVFIIAPDITSDRHGPDIGYWHCDIAHDEALTWSDIVYELFGLPHGALIDRNWAVARYSEISKSALDTVRTYAISRKLGFILDAEISPEGADNRWIRVLAVPIVRRGRVVGVHGLKRAL
jgi:hypothetical protein